MNSEESGLEPIQLENVADPDSNYNSMEEPSNESITPSTLNDEPEHHHKSDHAEPIATEEIELGDQFERRLLEEQLQSLQYWQKERLGGAGPTSIPHELCHLECQGSR